MPTVRSVRAKSFAAPAALSVLAATLLAAPVHAQINRFSDDVNTSVDRAFDPAPKDCADVRWSAATLRAFPSIGSACQSIEERNGRTYVKLEGTVEEVRDEGKRIRVDFQDGGKLNFTPTPRTALYIDGKRTEFGQLDDGTKLNFYIPEDRLQAELQPQPDRLAYVIVPIVVPSVTAAGDTASSSRGRDSMSAMNDSELPRTAGPLPLIGFGGAALLLASAGATLRRRLRWPASES